MYSGSGIRLPTGQFSTYVTPVSKDGVTRFVTPVGTNGVVLDGSVLPNGTLINGVANFYTNTKPVTRVDGSALVANDIWEDTANKKKYYWDTTNGWLSPEKEASADLASASFSSTTGTSYFLTRLRAVVIQEVSIQFFIGSGSLSVTDFWTFWITTNGNTGNVLSQDVTAGDSGAITNTVVKTFTGLSVAVSTATGGFIGTSFRKNAAAPNLTSVKYSIKYREVAP